MLALQLAEIAINNILQYNSAGSAQFNRLQGINLTLNIQLPSKPMAVETVESLLSLPALTDGNNFQCHLGFGQNNVVITQDLATSPDISVTGNPSAIAKWLLGNEQASGIEIKGDVSRIQQVQQWLKSVDIEWQDIIADIVGDVPLAVAKTARQEIERLAALINKPH